MIIPISRVIPHYCGIPERVRRKRNLLVFRAFFDESCLDPTKYKSLVFGGFLGKVEEWERASEAWDKCLHQSPSIEYFKHSEAMELDGQFIKFNRSSADAKVTALAKTLTDFKLLGVYVSVSFSWF